MIEIIGKIMFRLSLYMPLNANHFFKKSGILFSMLWSLSKKKIKKEKKTLFKNPI